LLCVPNDRLIQLSPTGVEVYEVETAVVVVVAGIVVVGVVVDTEGVDRSVQFNHYVIVTSSQHTSA